MYFDNFSIELKPTLIVQENHYYPFGLNLAGLEKRGQPNHKFQYMGVEKEINFGLNWNETLLRGYDLELGRWHQIDIKASERESPYVGMGNNPIILNDVLGDTVKYANDAIKKYVEKYTSPTKTKKNGKVVRNKSFNQSFADKILTLDKSKEVFEFTDDASKLKGSNSLGEMSIESDGSKFNIVVPEFTSGDKVQKTKETGGRDFVLFEETFHAFQVTKGDVIKTDKGDGTFGLVLSKESGGLLLVEAGAKIFAADAGVGNNTYTKKVQGREYQVKTAIGLIRETKKDTERRQNVGLMLRNGKVKTYHSTNGSKISVTHTFGY